MSGVKIASTSMPAMFPCSLLSLPPPKSAANCAICAKYDMTPAMVAAIVVIKMWANTPLSSSGDNKSIMPVVHATAACFGFLPVANALGVGVGMT